MSTSLNINQHVLIYVSIRLIQPFSGYRSILAYFSQYKSTCFDLCIYPSHSARFWLSINASLLLSININMFWSMYLSVSFSSFLYIDLCLSTSLNKYQHVLIYVSIRVIQPVSGYRSMLVNFSQYKSTCFDLCIYPCHSVRFYLSIHLSIWVYSYQNISTFYVCMYVCMYLSIYLSIYLSLLSLI